MTDNNNILIAHNIRLDLAGETLEVDGEAVALRRKPLLLLHALMSRSGELVTKRELIDLGWGSVPVTDAVLTTAIKEVRRALGDDARSPFAVENVHGRGYRFLLEVVEEPQAAAPAPASTPAVPASAKSRPRRPGSAALALGAGFAVVLLLLVLAAGPWGDGRSGRDAPPGGSAARSALPAVPSIAVLPLDDMSPAGDRRWFADGLTEEILNVLAQSPDLHVASRTSAFRFRGRRADIRDIGRELGVDYVMEGSVRTVGDRLRITVQLIHADDGLHVFSESWNRPFELDAVFAVQWDVSRRVLQALDAALGGPGAGVAPTPARSAADIDLAAYEDFLQGREKVNLRSADGVREGIALLQRSADAAPDFAPTHAALALGWLLAVQLVGEPMESALTRAAGHLRIAEALAPHSAEALNAAALLAMAQGEWERSLALADEAARRSPSSAEAHYRRAVALIRLGRHGEALDALRRASLVDPLSPVVNATLVLAYLADRQPAQALDAARHGLRWNPDHWSAQASLGDALLAVGDYTQSHHALNAALERSPQHPLVLIRRAELLWRVGLDEVLLAEARPAEATARAAALLARGDLDDALALLQKTGVERASNYLDALDVAYWAREQRLAAELAAIHVREEHLAVTSSAPAYRRETHAAIVTLGDDPLAKALHEALVRRFADWQPAADGPALALDFLGAAAWRMLDGDPDGALAWLEAAAARGFVLRELQFDPLFDDLREDQRFSLVLEAMEKTAARHRADILETLQVASATR